MQCGTGSAYSGALHIRLSDCRDLWPGKYKKYPSSGPSGVEMHAAEFTMTQGGGKFPVPGDEWIDLIAQDLAQSVHFIHAGAFR
jgi:hypothetical protein